MFIQFMIMFIQFMILLIQFMIVFIQFMIMFYRLWSCSSSSWSCLSSSWSCLSSSWSYISNSWSFLSSSWCHWWRWRGELCGSLSGTPTCSAGMISLARLVLLKFIFFHHFFTFFPLFGFNLFYNCLLLKFAFIAIRLLTLTNGLFSNWFC